MTLKQQIQKALKLPDSQFGSWCSDLHILWSAEVETWLVDNYEFPVNVTRHLANVEGHDWFGHVFLDIPFANEEYHGVTA